MEKWFFLRAGKETDVVPRPVLPCLARKDEAASRVVIKVKLA
jgi:hypothetical protein